VVSHVRALPVGLRYADGMHKRVLKHALAQRVPRNIWDLPKHGFDFPFDTLLAADDHALVRTHADAATLARLAAPTPGAQPHRRRVSRRRAAAALSRLGTDCVGRLAAATRLVRVRGKTGKRFIDALRQKLRCGVPAAATSHVPSSD
jgi:hypothetical protein